MTLSDTVITALIGSIPATITAIAVLVQQVKMQVELKTNTEKTIVLDEKTNVLDKKIDHQTGLVNSRMTELVAALVATGKAEVIAAALKAHTEGVNEEKARMSDIKESK
jgi:hypothetical protein